RLAVARQLLAIAQDRDAALSARVAHGDLPQYERDDNRRAVMQREGFVVSAERALAQSAIELSLYVRSPDGQPRVVEPGLVPPTLPDPGAPTAADASARASSDALRRRPDLRRLDAMREQFRVERDWARNQLAPGIDVAVIGSQDLGPGSATRERFELEASVLVDIPLRTRVATGRVRAAEEGMARVDAQARFARERITADVSDALSAMDAARERTDIARRELSLARDLAGAERQRFDLGESTLLMVNLREQAAAEAAVREIDALADHHRAAANLRASTATNIGPAPSPR
ncbi:MAG: TolC family protein, partial [Deltaproteobacteria bacterium]